VACEEYIEVEGIYGVLLFENTGSWGSLKDISNLYNEYWAGKLLADSGGGGVVEYQAYTTNIVGIL
jgi:hypothetical protein